MMNLYRFLLIFFISLLSQTVYAQSGMLSGNIIDEKGTAVSFANVAVIQTSDSSLVTGAITDAEGTFGIKSPATGSYFLRITAIGFKTIYTPAFKVADLNFSKDFGTLTVKEDVQLLKEVAVESMRPKIVTHADKMVVSVEGTALAAGSTAFDVLAKSPGIWIDQDGNIQLNGKAGVKVMIDGRPTYLSAKELQSMLEGMSAENIQDIEIITNPSAKYDAEGTSGILNINLKKNNLTGINGSVYAGYQNNEMQGYSAGANINHKKGQWNSFANIDIAQRGRYRDTHMIREFNNPESKTRFDQQGLEENARFSPSLRVGTDYELTKQHSIGAMINLSFQDSYHDWKTLSDLTDTDASKNTIVDARNYAENEFTSNTFNLHYQGKLDTLGTTISADLDYVKLTNDGNTSFTNKYTLLEGNTLRSEKFTTYNPSLFDIYSARIDFSKPLNTKTRLELGAKTSRVVSDNDLRFFEVNDEEKTLDMNKSSHFVYEENIYAAYANFSTKLSEKWNIQAGLRAEQTVGKGKSLTLDEITTREYLNLFPSLFVQQKVSDNYQVSYNYSRRIDRPHYESLNPFVFYLDPYTTIQGNPLLKPQYTHSVQVTQTIKQSYNLILGYDYTTDFMSEVPEQDNETKTTVFMQRNVDNFENISATIVAPVQPHQKWSINNNIVMAYQNYTTKMYGKPLQNEQFFFMAQTTNNIKLPHNLMLEISGAYQGPLAHGLYRIEGNWWVDSGIKRSFMNNKLDLSMSVTDIFRSRQIIGNANINGNINSFDQYFGAQSFRLNLRYRFNKGEKFETKNRNTNLEELNRAGGN